MSILLIDDRRNIVGAKLTARNYKDAITALQSNKWELVLLDHDLGDFQNNREYTGYDILCWLEEHKERLPKRIVLVTDNPSARQRMQLVIDKLYTKQG